MISTRSYNMRLDRFLTIHISQGLHRQCSGMLPVLMYHSVSEAFEAVSAYYRTATSPKIFEEQMTWLRAEGYKAVSLQEGHDLLRQGGCVEKVVAVTFDDGFRDFHTNAFPVLKENGFSATMFLPTAFIGEKRLEFKGRECMTWSEVRELHQAGIEFGSHTVNHPKLYELGYNEIREQLELSKSVIENKLGAAICSFAYPYAFPSADREFVEAFTDLLKRAGYSSNATTRIGRVSANDNPFTLKRLPVNSADDLALFRAKIRGAYDWMNWPQNGLKKIKTIAAKGRSRTQPRLCRAP